MISLRLCAMLRVDDDGESVTDRSIGWKADVHTQQRRGSVRLRKVTVV